MFVCLTFRFLTTKTAFTLQKLSEVLVHPELPEKFQCSSIVFFKTKISINWSKSAPKSCNFFLCKGLFINDKTHLRGGGVDKKCH